MQVIWPANELPVELFVLIISYLPRESIQNMRLVNHEFEEKVSEYLFKRVVVPFKPELYSISEASPRPQGTAGNTAESHGAVLLQDKGMRVFQGFGAHIRQFALSFEFDEALLTRPPMKTDQKAVTTFWGIYRWPFKEYNRYRQLEGLEQTADETRTMANALRYITKAKELGLSIDGGIGWLSGPDSRVKSTGKPMVFGGPRVAPEDESNKAHRPLITPNASFSFDPTCEPFFPDGEGDLRETQREVLLERMLRESGYHGPLLTRSLRTLAESEGPAPLHPMQNNLAEVNPARNEAIESALRASGYVGPTLTNMRTLLNQREYNLGGHPEHRRLDDLELDVRELGRTAISMRSSTNMQDHNNVLLKPNELTNAQKEMLLEIEWAQRAFMQSWAIAIIDNVDTFSGVETLTIARLPSRHLPIIKRDDFWNSLPSLKKISLAVIPDWREVVKLPTSFVQDIKLEPSRAISTVYDLIREHIAPRENIKSLHFEWICGGEEAAGAFARNKHILAAPLVHRALDMVNMVHLPTILNMPHLEHLSLKNCWISPHVLQRFADKHRQPLSSLTLNSVSMCARPPRHAQPGAAQHHAAGQLLNMQGAGNQPQQAAMQVVVQHLQGALGGHDGNGPALGGPGWAVAPNNPPQLQPIPGNANHPHNAPWNHPALPHIPQPPVVIQAPANPAAPTPAAPASWRRDPRNGSWAHIIDNLTPCKTMAMIRYDSDRNYEKPPTPRPQKLRKLEFISCGYVHLPLDYDQSVLQPPNFGAAEANDRIRRRHEHEQYMLKSLDAAMGTIINHIHPIEALQLEHAFNMQLGWQGDDARLREERAEADGIVSPGTGRFTGTVQRDEGNARTV